MTPSSDSAPSPAPGAAPTPVQRPHRPRIRLPAGLRAQDVPAVQVDSHLLAVPDAAQTIAALRERFERQPVWTPEWVSESQWLDFPQGFTPIAAAVLIPIVVRPEPTVLFTQRSARLNTHSGQVAFPGGRLDAYDRDAVAAALREAQEEIALAPEAVQVLGTMPSYLTGTGFEVTPVVGLVPPGLPLQPNPHEVDEIFEVPLRFLLDPANHRHHVFSIEGMERRWLSMPYVHQGREYFIWGVTASLLRNFYRFMRA